MAEIIKKTDLPAAAQAIRDKLGIGVTPTLEAIPIKTNPLKDEITSSHGSHSTRSNNTLEAQKRLNSSGDFQDESPKIATESGEKKEKGKKEEEKNGKSKNKKKGRKRRKNPFAPKQPKSAYNYFVQERMAELKLNYGDCKHSLLLRRVIDDWKNLPDKTRYEEKAKNDKLRYQREKNNVCLYHKMPEIKKPPNAFILFMQERSKNITLESLENYKPPETKPRKRSKKAKEKKEENQTTLLKIKTGEEVDENASSSDNRSTNPSSMSMTLSCNTSDMQVSEIDDKSEKAPNVSQINEKEFLVPKKKKKVDRKELLSKISQEWKNLPETDKQVYRYKAKQKMAQWKRKKESKMQELFQKAKDRRDTGVGVIKHQRTVYNLYMQDKMKERKEECKRNNEEFKYKEEFKKIAKAWGEQDNMEKWQELSIKDNKRFEDDLEKFFEQDMGVEGDQEQVAPEDVDEEILVQNIKNIEKIMPPGIQGATLEYTPYTAHLEGMSQSHGEGNTEIESAFKVPFNKPKKHIEEVEVVEVDEGDMPLDFLADEDTPFEEPKEEELNQIEDDIDDIPADAEQLQEDKLKEEQILEKEEDIEVKEEIKNEEYGHLENENQEMEAPKLRGKHMSDQADKYKVTKHFSIPLDAQSESSIALTIKKN